MSGSNCPLCDVRDSRLSSVESFALGVALGSMGHDALTAKMCTHHQGAFGEVLVRMLSKIQRFMLGRRS